MLILGDGICERGHVKAHCKKNVFIKRACHKIRMFFTLVVVTVINSNICMKLNMWACGKIRFRMKGTDIGVRVRSLTQMEKVPCTREEM